MKFADCALTTSCYGLEAVHLGPDMQIDRRSWTIYADKRLIEPASSSF